MSRAVEHNHRQIFDIASETPRNVLQVVFHRGINVDDPARRWPNYNLVHVDIGCIQQTTPFGGSQNCNRVVGAKRAEVRALERIDGYINLRTRFSNLLTNTKAAAYFFANVEHRRFVTFAFANHHAPAHGHSVHYFPHCFDSYVIRKLSITLTHGSGGSYCRGFGYAQEIQRQLALCSEVVTHLLLLVGIIRPKCTFILAEHPTIL